MPRKPSRILNYGVYLALRCALCVFHVVSNSTGRALIAGLAWIIYFGDRRHRLVALDNLRKAFPGRYSESKLNALVRGSYTHFITVIVELSLMPRKVHRNTAAFHLDMGLGEQTLLDLLQSERPVLFVTGHFGNWEMAGYGIGAYGLHTYAISRPLDNPYMETYLRRCREGMGQTMLDKYDLRRIKTVLDQGGKIALLADQSAGSRGLMVDFFGRAASTHKGVAVLALQHGAPLVVLGIRKVAEPMRYETVLEDVIYPEEYSGARAEIVQIGRAHV